MQIGAQAPELKLIDQNGNCGFDLASYAGSKKVVLVFHRGLWCGFCKGQLNVLNGGLQQIQNENAVVVGISPERVDDSVNPHFSRQASAWNIPALRTGYIENDDDIYSAFIGSGGGNPTRTVVVIDTNGRVAKRISGASYSGSYDTGHVAVTDVVQALQAAS